MNDNKLYKHTLIFHHTNSDRKILTSTCFVPKIILSSRD